MLAFAFVIWAACHSQLLAQKLPVKEAEIRLITLDPAHFHAALLQKTNLPHINKEVYVYASPGPGLETHLALIESFNKRAINPTKWNEKVYSGPDFLEKMLSQKKGNVVVLAGNNRTKPEYIFQSVNAGLNVLADKPMALDKPTFEKLKNSFAIAKKKGVIIYDIMTERYDLLNILNRQLMQDHALFGSLCRGSEENPAIELESVHHFYKTVSGKPLVRPTFYYDVEQQGEGIVDVTTHLIDLVHWKCFPEQSLSYEKDIRVTGAKHWSTPITPSQFQKSTGMDAFPDYLQKYVRDSILQVYANGAILYQVKGIHVSIKVTWNFQALDQGGDTHRSIIKGSKATLFILQDKEQGYSPRLYIRRDTAVSQREFASNLKQAIQNLPYKGITALECSDGSFEIKVPAELKEGHEAHFGRVAEKYFSYLTHNSLPAWEVPNMLAKYYITTTALEMAKTKTK